MTVCAGTKVGAMNSSMQWLKPLSLIVTARIAYDESATLSSLHITKDRLLRCPRGHVGLEHTSAVRQCAAALRARLTGSACSSSISAPPRAACSSANQRDYTSTVWYQRAWLRLAASLVKSQTQRGSAQQDGRRPAQQARHGVVTEATTKAAARCACLAAMTLRARALSASQIPLNICNVRGELVWAAHRDVGGGLGVARAGGALGARAGGRLQLLCQRQQPLRRAAQQLKRLLLRTPVNPVN